MIQSRISGMLRARSYRDSRTATWSAALGPPVTEINAPGALIGLHMGGIPGAGHLRSTQHAGAGGLTHLGSRSACESGGIVSGTWLQVLLMGRSRRRPLRALLPQRELMSYPLRPEAVQLLRTHQTSLRLSVASDRPITSHCESD